MQLINCADKIDSRSVRNLTLCCGRPRVKTSISMTFFADHRANSSVETRFCRIWARQSQRNRATSCIIWKR